MVPETLLKKRKSQEKARAERAAEIENRKKVSCSRFAVWKKGNGRCDAQTHFATRQRSMLLQKYHLSGLIRRGNLSCYDGISLSTRLANMQFPV